MESEFIYWRHILPCGVKVEEVSGTAAGSQRVWRAMALQIYCENGREGYRQIDHLPCGAPLLVDASTRISLTHTAGMLAVASLPSTPEADLSEFSLRTALGIDAERADRAQALRIRSKFLSEEELRLVAEDDVKANITAWTAKEALYKAALCPGLDFREAIRISELPTPGEHPHGRAEIILPQQAQPIEMELYAYESEGCIITVAFSPKCAKWEVRKKSSAPAQ